MPKKGSVKRTETMPVRRNTIIQDTYSITNNLTGPKRDRINFDFFFFFSNEVAPSKQSRQFPAMLTYLHILAPNLSQFNYPF